MNDEKPVDDTKACQTCFGTPCDCKELLKPYNDMLENDLKNLRYQITNLLFLMDTSKHQLEFAKTMLDGSKKKLDETISDFIVAADETNRNDLVRFLYWKTQMSPSEIASLIDVAKERVYGIAGPLPIQMKCGSCHRQFVSTIRSRNEQPSTTCSSCDALKIRKEHETWMNQWTDTPMNSPINYGSYLSSHAWKTKARQMREKANFKCQLCACTDKPLNVHHNNYDRLGRERDDDLIVLCEPCHHKFHQSSS